MLIRFAVWPESAHRVRSEPAQNSLFELFGRDLVCAGVNGTGHLPYNDVRRIVRLDFIRMERGDVAVFEAVDEHYRDPCSLNRFLG